MTDLKQLRPWQKLRFGSCERCDELASVQVGEEAKPAETPQERLLEEIFGPSDALPPVLLCETHAREECDRRLESRGAVTSRRLRSRWSDYLRRLLPFYAIPVITYDGSEGEASRRTVWRARWRCLEWLDGRFGE